MANGVRTIHCYIARTGMVVFYDVAWDFSQWRTLLLQGRQISRIVRRESAQFLDAGTALARQYVNAKHGCYNTAPLSYISSRLVSTNLYATSNCCTSELYERPTVVYCVPAHIHITRLTPYKTRRQGDAKCGGLHFEFCGFDGSWFS